MGRTNVFTILGFYILDADEIGCVLTLGKLSGIVKPGLGWCSPIIQSIVKTKKSASVSS